MSTPQILGYLFIVTKVEGDVVTAACTADGVTPDPALGELRMPFNVELAAIKPGSAFYINVTARPTVQYDRIRESLAAKGFASIEFFESGGVCGVKAVKDGSPYEFSIRGDEETFLRQALISI